MSPVAKISDYDSLITALRTRAMELSLTHQTLDEITGLQSGYTSKLFGPRQIKRLGPMSMFTLLEALGLRIEVVEDPEAAKRMAGRYDKRKVAPSTLPMRSIPRATWLIGTRQARKLNRIRVEKLSAKQRSRIAKNAAKTRWKKERKKKRERRRLVLMAGRAQAAIASAAATLS